ncbi:MAG TPA: PEP-CTERM sorting domain-containing protein [Chthoniobacterales bacterium]|nr:PEP-CTERM sorting domain-containing protein [Chthoniobacterales bacterium]
MKKAPLIGCLSLSLALFTFASSVSAQVTVRTATGTTAADITGTRDAFREDLGGGTAAGANGSFGGLRREINWDGTPAMFAAPNTLPPTFFNVNSPRGVLFSTPGTGFQVSGATTDTGPGQPAALRFGNIDSSYTNTFATFSAERLFTSLGSNITDINFFVPGTNTPGLTRGFGVVFTDVDLANATAIQLFDVAHSLLGTFYVPNLKGNQTFSFVGISYPTPVISSVRILAGNAPLGPGAVDQNGTIVDVVAMDDFIYGEPVAIPEPSTVAMLIIGGGLLLRAARKRRAA